MEKCFHNDTKYISYSFAVRRGCQDDVTKLRQVFPQHENQGARKEPVSRREKSSSETHRGAKNCKQHTHESFCHLRSTFQRVRPPITAKTSFAGHAPDSYAENYQQSTASLSPHVSTNTTNNLATHSNPNRRTLGLNVFHLPSWRPRLTWLDSSSSPQDSSSNPPFFQCLEKLPGPLLVHPWSDWLCGVKGQCFLGLFPSPIERKELITLEFTVDEGEKLGPRAEIRPCPTAPIPPDCPQVLPIAPKCLSTASKCPLLLPDAPPIVPHCPQMSPTAPKYSHCPQVPPTAPKCPQLPPSVFPLPPSAFSLPPNAPNTLK
ncbi:unnamed protein product [Nesidiocoris tenuis]|uniref:Uncharacterized protein n=1 Tax=Nesidiocoris tenuis TaxID=355587 RepID=A0A6H5FYY3_9HEMI|nr:unnamed protein product [Nesidiocoris tenuis]